MEARKFRKKPIIVEALQYTEESRRAVIDWCGAGHTGIDDDGCEYELRNLRIKTPAGTLMVNLGDWVVKDANGEFCPCKPDIFEQTYEEVDAKEPISSKELMRKLDSPEFHSAVGPKTRFT